jgi:hypothetical protein
MLAGLRRPLTSKKTEKLGPKVPQVVHFFARTVFLKIVWWAAVLLEATIDN